jgi:hypothetical protein
MASRRPETMAKRARELAVKERRDRKRAKKAEAAERRAAANSPTSEIVPDDAQAEAPDLD